MKKKAAGSVFTEYIVVCLFCSLAIYFALVGNSGEDDPTGASAPPLVQAVHDRQTSFIDSVLAP